MIISTLLLIGLVSPALADTPGAAKGPPATPTKLIGTYERTPAHPAHDLTVDKANSCGEAARGAILKMAESVSRVTVLANSITINNGKPTPIKFATQEAVVSNTVLDRDDRFTTALRIMFLGDALTFTYNKVERETADWCSDSWGVLVRKN